MAGGYPRGPSRKPPPSSSSHSNRKSRWESTSSSAGTSNHRSSISAVALKNKSSAGASSSDSKVANNSNHKPNPASDKNPTPKRGNPNPSPRTHHHPNPHPNSAPRGPMPPPGAPYSLADSPFGPPPSPTYGFHMLERRTIVLADGSAHTYLALPLDYQDFNPPPRLLDHLPRFPPSGPDLVGPVGRFPPFGPMSPNGFRGGEDPFARNRNQNQNQDYWDSLGLDGRAGGAPEGSMKRKYGEAEGGVKDDLARQRQHVLQYGNVGATASGSPYRREDEFSRASKSMRIGGTFDTGMDAFHHYHTVEPAALKMAFLKFAKLLNDSLNGQKKDYLENGKNGPLKCIACQRSSKDFPDVHSLVVHAYNSDMANLRLDHLGLHKALCVLMGWNYMKPPDNSRAYQFLPADEASVNQDDLILWPPTVMILNTVTGKGKDGQMEGMGNKAMDSKIRAMGFHNFKPKSLYNREGHLGIILIKFSADQAGLRQAIQLNEHFEKQNCGRRGWAQVQSKLSGMDTENNPMLVEVDPRTGENNRILYGHLFTAFDLDKADFETKKKAALESKRDYLRSM